MGKLSFIPAVVGFWAGVLFLLLLDNIVPHLHLDSNDAEGPKSALSRSAKLVLAVTLHNIPEGMAVGVVYAALLSGSTDITVTEHWRSRLELQYRIFRRGNPLHAAAQQGQPAK